MAGLLDFLSRLGVAGQESGERAGLLGNMDSPSGRDAFDRMQGLLLTLGGHDQVGAQMMAAPGQRRASQEFSNALQQMMGGQQPQAAPQPQGQPMSAPGMEAPFASPQIQSADMGQVPIGSSRMPDSGPAAAIAGIESGGDYEKLGPVTRTGDRAFGKYQVMGANIPSWTQEVLGQPMSAEQFLRSPQAQDAVFQAKFGAYTQKYGPEGAARAWFAGEGGMNDPNRKDQLGTSVSAYANKFNTAMGGQPGMMQAQPAMQPPSPMPAMQGGPQMAQAQGAPMQQAAPAMQGPQPGQLPPKVMGLMKVLMNPALPAPQREMGKMLLTRALDETKMPDDYKKFLLAKSQGFPGSYPDFINQPSYGDIGKDEFDRDIKGWRNPNTLAVTPSQIQGGKPPEAMVKELRKEIQDLPSYKNIAQSAPVYKSMLSAASRDNRAADVNLIYGFAKLMDPGSVVRESEMTIAQAISTLPQHLQASISSQLQATGRLSPEVRAAIMQEAHSRVSAYDDMFKQDSTQFQGIAQRRRMNLQDVIPNFGEFKPWEPPKAASAPSGQPSRSDIMKELQRRGVR